MNTKQAKMVRVRALKDDVIIDPAAGRVKKGTEAELCRHDAEHWAARGLVEIVKETGPA